jgi:hypothetical protein
LRQTRAISKIRRSPDASSFLAVNSGEVCRKNGAARAGIADRFGGEGVQVGLVAGRDLQGGRFDLREALLLEPAAHGAADAAPALRKGARSGAAWGSTTEKAVRLAMGCVRRGLAISPSFAIGARQHFA